METVSISRFKATCLGALERVRKTGRPLLITKRGIPIAQVVPPPRQAAINPSAFGCMKEGTEELHDMLRPLPSEEWEALG